MAFRVRVTVKNNTAQPVTATIHKGSVFEVLDPFSRVQNLVAAETKTITVAPGAGPQIIDLETWCFNEPYAPPAGQPMRITMFRTSANFASQKELWDDQRHRS